MTLNNNLTHRTFSFKCCDLATALYSYMSICIIFTHNNEVCGKDKLRSVEFSIKFKFCFDYFSYEDVVLQVIFSIHNRLCYGYGLLAAGLNKNSNNNNAPSEKLNYV